MMPTSDDATLVTQAQAGDRQALGELLSRHRRAMLAIARAYFAAEADAEDAVQEGTTKVWQALGQLEDAQRFSGWVVRIMVNICLEVLRTRKDKVSLADFATSVQVFPRSGQEALTPAALASQHEHADLLRIAIGRLSEEHRVALMLRYSEDMSYEAIGAYLDVPLSTVRSRLFKAKRALGDMLNSLGLSPT